MNALASPGSTNHGSAGRSAASPLAAAVLMALCASLVPAAAGAGQTYSVVDVGRLADGDTIAFDLNEARQVTGWGLVGQQPHAYLWEDGVFLDINEGYANSMGTAIAPDGSVAGLRVPIAVLSEAFLRYPDGSFADIHADIREVVPEVNHSFALDVNRDGTVVGSAAEIADPPGDGPGFVWSPDDLRFLQGFQPDQRSSQGRAVNRWGDVAGLVDTPTDFLGALWLAARYDDPIELVGFLGNGEGVFVAGINDATQVVGSAQRPDPLRQTAFRWEDGKLVDLGTLGFAEASAEGINNAGTVVGQVCGDGVCEATIWPAPGAGFLLRERTFNDPDWSFESASAINEEGVVSGLGLRTGDLVARGYLAVPDLATSAPDAMVAGTPVTFTVRDGVPGSTVRLLGAPATGTTPLPDCAGTEVDLATPKSLAMAVIGADGTAALVVTPPGDAAGRTLHFQVAGPGTCTVGNRLQRNLQ